MLLSKSQLQRYSRHIVLPEIGIEGQQKIMAARVFVVGAGGLGSPVSLYLAAAGVGRLGIIDSDKVELSNLHRQITHTTKRVGMPKVDSARIALEAINPDVRIDTFNDNLDKGNILEMFNGYDIVVDCSDNFATRFLINDTCVLTGKPLVTGAILRFEGQVTTILPGRSHCYRCLFEDMPPSEYVLSTEVSGLIGAVPGVIGPLQAMEVLKMITGTGKLLTNRLLLYDALKTRFRKVRIPRNPECPVCSELSSRK